MSKKLKIMNIMLSKELGGIQQMFVNYAKVMSLKEHDVINIIHHKAQIISDLKKEKLPFKTLSNFSAYDFFAKLKLWFLIIKERPDVILSHTNRSNNLLKFLPIKTAIIAITHNHKIKHIKSFDGVIIVSAYLKESVLRCGFAQQKIFLLENFI